ncbi:MAG: hypothetical protein SGCHY_002249 [Lobulomycetales sp.]
MPVFNYKVEMTCTGCSGAVERILAKEPRVTKVVISLEAQTVAVTAEDSITKDEVTALIKKSGKETTVL